MQSRFTCDVRDAATDDREELCLWQLRIQKAQRRSVFFEEDSCVVNVVQDAL
jgi:hypothetical protein